MIQHDKLHFQDKVRRAYSTGTMLQHRTAKVSLKSLQEKCDHVNGVPQKSICQQVAFSSTFKAVIESRLSTCCPVELGNENRSFLIGTFRKTVD